jgi:hypothetical protein
MRRHRDNLGPFARLLGGVGEEKLVFVAIWCPESQPVALEDLPYLSEKHLDPLALRGEATEALMSLYTSGPNFSDRFSYALAKARGATLLLKGNNFALTDIEAAASAVILAAIPPTLFPPRRPLPC